MSLVSTTQDYCMERLTIRNNFPIELQWNNMTMTISNFQFGQKIKTSKNTNIDEQTRLGDAWIRSFITKS